MRETSCQVLPLPAEACRLTERAGSSTSFATPVLLAAQPGVVAVLADVLDALGRLAAHVMGELRDTTVVGITGSQGKTSTKDLVGDVLSTQGPTVAARASEPRPS